MRRSCSAGGASKASQPSPLAGTLFLFTHCWRFQAILGVKGYRGRDARAWIFTIVRNCYHNWLVDRRRKSRLEVDPYGKGDSEELILNISSDEDTPEAMLVREAETQTVRFILNTMSRPLREILVLREIEELSYRQISDVTALPIGTVMSRLARARKAFGDAWGRETKNTG